jgi:hypothetical protein
MPRSGLDERNKREGGYITVRHEWMKMKKSLVIIELF